MPDSDNHYHSRRRGLPFPLMVLVAVGGVFAFLYFFQVSGLDGISIRPKNRGSGIQDAYYGDYSDYDPTLANDLAAISSVGTTLEPNISTDPSEVTLTSTPAVAPVVNEPEPVEASKFSGARLKIASWAMGGFNASKLANGLARRNAVRVLRRFDLIAIQQIASIERDLIPRLVDAANEGNLRFDYVLGESTGPVGEEEQMAFVFDVKRVQVDRTQTYTVADPQGQMKYDPLVAWFRAKGPSSTKAWTFSMVNVRIDLGRAPQEVELLGRIMSSVRTDGRGEDDVVMAGLFQADDAYLLPTISAKNLRAAVRNSPTDIFGRHQTCNLLLDSQITSEYIGRGGAFDFLRVFNLSAAEAETVTSHLPVFAEFSIFEGGQL